jgi:hypothetical protein
MLTWAVAFLMIRGTFRNPGMVLLIAMALDTVQVCALAAGIAHFHR